MFGWNNKYRYSYLVIFSCFHNQRLLFYNKPYTQKKDLIPLITCFRKTKPRVPKTPKKRAAETSTMQSPWDPGGAIYLNTPRGPTATPVRAECKSTPRLVKSINLRWRLKNKEKKKEKNKTESKQLWFKHLYIHRFSPLLHDFLIQSCFNFHLCCWLGNLKDSASVLHLRKTKFEFHGFHIHHDIFIYVLVWPLFIFS